MSKLIRKFWFIIFWGSILGTLSLSGNNTTLQLKKDSLELKLKELSSCFSSCQEELVLVYDELNQTYIQSFDPRTDSIARLSLAYAEKINNAALKLSAYYAIARHAIYIGRYELSIGFAKKGLELSRKIENTDYPETKFLNTLGLANYYMENYEEGVFYFLEVIDLLESKYDSTDIRIYPIIPAILNIGTTYGRQFQVEKSLEYYYSGLKKLGALQKKYADDNQMMTSQGSLLGSIGKAYFTLAERSKGETRDSLLALANKNYFLATQILEASGHSNNLSVSYHFLGDLYTAQDSLDQAEFYLLKAIQIREELSLFNMEYIEICTDLGKLYKNKKDYERSLIYLEEAIQEGTKEGNQQMLAEAYKEKAYVLQLQKKFESAYVALEKYVGINIKFQDKLHLDRINKLNARHESERADQVRQKEEAQATVRRAKILVAFLGTLLILLVLLIYFYYQRLDLQARHRLMKKKGEDLEKAVRESKIALDAKSTELTNMARMMADRSTIVEEVKEKLLAFEKEKGISLGPVLKSIQISQSNLADIDRFQKILNEVSADFFFILQKWHPDLTENERRLAAMIKLGWPSTQIASLEDTSASTVRTRKSRLKKKLEIEDLEDYLNRLK